MLALPLLTAAVLSQGFVDRFGPPPDLVIGQKVKLHIAAPAQSAPLFIPTPMPGPRMRHVFVVGTLTDYEPHERISVLGHGWPFSLAPTSERSVDWIDLLGIEVPQRRNALNAVNGAAAGFGAALGWGLMAGIFDSFFCTKGARCDRDAWDRTKQVAPYAVPIGAVIGFVSTRWKRVY